MIFSQFTRVLDIVDDYLNMRGYEFARLDGSTNRVQRMVRIVRLFSFHSILKHSNTGTYSRVQQGQLTYFAMIMSTRAGGMGIIFRPQIR